MRRDVLPQPLVTQNKTINETNSMKCEIQNFSEIELCGNHKLPRIK